MIIKVNAITDDQMIRVLYRASQAGVSHRPDRARHLQPASRHPGRQRQHPRALDRRPLPRALAHLLVPQRRARGDVHRQRRPDGAQPRSARRDADAGPRPGDPASTSATSCLHAYLQDTERAMVLDSSRPLPKPYPTGERSTRSSSCSSTIPSRETIRRSARPTPVRDRCERRIDTEQRKGDRGDDQQARDGDEEGERTERPGNARPTARGRAAMRGQQANQHVPTHRSPPST